MLTTSPVTSPSPSSGRRLERDHGFAGVDPNAHLEQESGIVRVQLLDRLQHPETGPHRALRVVLVRDRRPEHRHHGIPDELLHRPAEPLQLLPQARVIRTDPSPDILRVGDVGGRSEADEIAEQNRNDLPLFVHRGRGLLSQ